MERRLGMEWPVGLVGLAVKYGGGPQGQVVTGLHGNELDTLCLYLVRPHRPAGGECTATRHGAIGMILFCIRGLSRCGRHKEQR